MKLLFEIDFKDYDPNWKIVSRPSARAIIIKDNKVYMIHNMKYDFYEFPGGGLEEGESLTECLIRETKEEAGLIIKLESIKEFGYVHRIHKDRYDELTFIQDNYYYLCDVENNIINQSLTEREQEEGFILELVDFNTVINVNRNNNHGPIFNPIFIEKDTKVLEMVLEYLKK